MLFSLNARNDSPQPAALPYRAGRLRRPAKTSLQAPWARKLAARQAEAARRDDVALNLRRTRGDGRRHRAHVLEGELRLEGRVLVVLARPAVRVQTEDLGARARESLNQLRVEELGGRGLVVGDLPSALHR